jgi:hypothetical protein
MICVCCFMGSVLKIIGVVFLVLVVLLIGAGVYFYNYHVFKEIRLCVGEGVDSEMSCNVTADCTDFAGDQGLDVDLSDAPNFVRENFQMVVDEAVYCDGTCFVKNIRGIDRETQELEMLESCDSGEVEFVIEIRGKEGVEVLKYLKGRE